MVFIEDVLRGDGVVFGKDHMELLRLVMVLRIDDAFLDVAGQLGGF
jgi:hypothetical protein